MSGAHNQSSGGLRASSRQAGMGVEGGGRRRRRRQRAGWGREGRRRTSAQSHEGTTSQSWVKLTLPGKWRAGILASQPLSGRQEPGRRTHSVIPSVITKPAGGVRLGGPSKQPDGVGGTRRRLVPSRTASSRRLCELLGSSLPLHTHTRLLGRDSFLLSIRCGREGLEVSSPEWKAGGGGTSARS